MCGRVHVYESILNVSLEMVQYTDGNSFIISDEIA